MKKNNPNAQTQIHDALLRAQPQPDAETQRRLEERVIEALRKEQTPMMEEQMDSGHLQYSLFGTRYKTLRTQRSILTTAAAMAILVIVGGLLILRLLPTSMRSASLGAQITPPALDTLVPITVENAAQLAPLYSLGTGSLMNAQWSPDGQTIVLATTKGLYVQDANDLNAPGVRLPGVEGTRFSGGVMYSADSTRIAAITGELLPDAAILLDPTSETRNAFPYTYALMVWDATTGEVLAKIDGVSGNVVGFVEENTQVVTETCAERVDGICVDDQYALKFWDIASGQEIIEKRYLFEETPYQYQITSSVVISADGQLMVYHSGSGNNNKVRVVNLHEPQQSFVVKPRTNQRFALSSDGTRLAVTPTGTNELILYDLQSVLDDPDNADLYAQHIRFPDGASLSLDYNWAAFSSDARRLVTANSQGMVLIYDLPEFTGAPMAGMGQGEETEMSLRVLPTSATGHYFDRHFSPDGTKMLLQAIAGGTLMMYDLQTGGKTQHSDVFHPYYYDLQFSDETLVGSQVYWPDGKARLFDLSGQTPTEAIFPGDVTNDGSPLYNAMQVRLSSGGRYALFQNDDGYNSVISLRWLDRHTRKSYRFQANRRTVTLGFAEDGSALVLYTNSFIHRYNFASLVSADGPKVTIAGERVPDSSTILEGSPASMYPFIMRAAFNPDGRIIVLSTSNELRVYSTVTGALLARLDGLDYPQGREEISFSDDGRYVTAGGCISFEPPAATLSSGQLYCNEPHARIWDVNIINAMVDANPELEPRLVDPLTIIPIVNFSVGMSSGIEGLTSLPILTDDGETQGFLVAVGDFTQTRVWFIKTVNSDANQPAEPQLLATLPGEVQSLAFSPDETLLAVGGPGVVTLYGIADGAPSVGRGS